MRKSLLSLIVTLGVLLGALCDDPAAYAQRRTSGGSSSGRSYSSGSSSSSRSSSSRSSPAPAQRSPAPSRPAAPAPSRPNTSGCKCYSSGGQSTPAASSPRNPTFPANSSPDKKNTHSRAASEFPRQYHAAQAQRLTKPPRPLRKENRAASPTRINPRVRVLFPPRQARPLSSAVAARHTPRPATIPRRHKHSGTRRVELPTKPGLLPNQPTGRPAESKSRSIRSRPRWITPANPSILTCGAPGARERVLCTAPITAGRRSSTTTPTTRFSGIGS